MSLKDFRENQNLKNVFEYFEKYLNEMGGLKREDILFKELSNEKNKNFVYFLLELGDDFFRLGDNDDLYPFWAIEKSKDSAVFSMVKKIKDFFQKEKKPMNIETLAKNLDIQDSLFLKTCLEIAKHIEVGPLGVYGLSAWPEIKPRGVRDAAFLVLKKYGEPLHFREIAAKAGDLQGDLFKKRKMLPQTSAPAATSALTLFTEKRIIINSEMRVLNQDPGIMLPVNFAGKNSELIYLTEKGKATMYKLDNMGEE